MFKIAVPTRAGQVDEHFGHCESFTIYSVNDTRAIVGQVRFTPPPDCGCKSNLVDTLSEMGVTALIAGNMGEGAVQKLVQAGIKVYRGVTGDVGEAVQAWLDGKIKDRDILCAAHEHGHGCSNGHGAL
jgi:predicted Fe-Mo cluster-binding NifX family protein